MAWQSEGGGIAQVLLEGFSWDEKESQDCGAFKVSWSASNPCRDLPGADPQPRSEHSHLMGESRRWREWDFVLGWSEASGMKEALAHFQARQSCWVLGLLAQRQPWYRERQGEESSRVCVESLGSHKRAKSNLPSMPWTLV